MIRALWTAATGMEAQQISQDVTANNLANINTVGFKKARADFQDLMYQVSSQSGAETSDGGQLPVGVEVGMGVKPVAVQKMFTQGDYMQSSLIIMGVLFIPVRVVSGLTKMACCAMPKGLN